MFKEIELVFHNQGLRSYIEVDLCRECPRQDDKGCCGHYSPVFYPSDFAYLLQNHPDIMNYLMNIEDVTVLDASLTVNNSIDGDSYKCHFHRADGGCLLKQLQRESICRHFVCPGIGWEKEARIKHWKDFFSRLEDYEIALNLRIADILKAQGLSLRDKDRRPLFFHHLLTIFQSETKDLPPFLRSCPPVERFTIKRQIYFRQEWRL